MSTVVVVGAGVAGLAAALSASAAGADVTLVTKDLLPLPAPPAAVRAQAPHLAAALREFAGRGEELLRSGEHAGDPVVVAQVCRSAGRLAAQFASAGPARPPAAGALGPDAAEEWLNGRLRSVLAARLAAAAGGGTVRAHQGLRAVEVLLDAAGRVRGLAALNTRTLESVEFDADAVVLADGGGSAMYAPSASADSACDGLALGLAAGAEAIDMEFVDFDPAGLVTEVIARDGSPVTELLASARCRLVDRLGECFAEGPTPLSRPHLARAVHQRVLAGRGFDDGSVHLELGAGARTFVERRPALHARLVQAGFDVTRDTVLPVRPRARALLGGLRIDGRGRTGVPGLYAAGDTVGGIHGAACGGAQGPAAAAATGRLAGRHAAAERATASAVGGPRPTGGFRFAGRGPDSAEAILRELRTGMYLKAGPVRDAAGLTQMLGHLGVLEQRLRHVGLTAGPGAAAQVCAYLDVRHLLPASRAVVEAALRREESRGVHVRSDFPSSREQYVGYGVRLDRGELAWRVHARRAVTEPVR